MTTNFFTDDQAKEWFDLSGIGKSAARFDFKKLPKPIRSTYRRGQDAANEINELSPKNNQPAFDDEKSDGLLRAMYCLKRSRQRHLVKLLKKVTLF